MNPFSLEGKTILVTGASSGIGRGIAIECSKMGARVVLSGRNDVRLQETLSMMVGKGHQILPADLFKIGSFFVTPSFWLEPNDQMA